MNNNAEMARPLHPSVDPKLKRIVPQFGWGDEFIKQLDQSKPGTAVDFDRHGVFIKREDGLWDTLVRQAMMTETLTVDELPPAHPSCRCAVKYHMKPAERPKNKEPEEPEPLPTDESDGIINTGSDMHQATYEATHEAMYGVDSEGYHHETTPAIQQCQSTDEIAALFTKDGQTIIDVEKFSKLPLDVQKEVAEGLSWSVKTYGVELPNSVTTRVYRGSTQGEYSDELKTVFIRSNIERGFAFPTVVHEMTHHAINLTGVNPDDIEAEAWKKLMRAWSSRFGETARTTWTQGESS